MKSADSFIPKTHQIDVDVMSPGPFTEQEREAFAKWYREYHGDGDLDSARFVSFWLDNGSQYLKHFRRWVETNVNSPSLVPPSGTLVMLHTYTVLGWEAGAQYELIACLKFGAKKRHVLETMAFAFIHAGPKGMSQVAKACDAFLRKWDDDPSKPTEWPEGWRVEPEALRSGIDFGTRGMTSSEIEKLENWYLTNQGEIPSYVPYLAQVRPDGLKAFRNRYENCCETLPKQMFPLMAFNTAAVQGRVGAMRRAAFQARHYGVKLDQLIPIIGRSMAYTGDLGTADTIDTIKHLIDDWPDG